MGFYLGQRVRSTSGVEGEIILPASSAAIQASVKVGPHGHAIDACLVLTGDGEVRRFREDALTPIED